VTEADPDWLVRWRERRTEKEAIFRELRLGYPWRDVDDHDDVALTVIRERHQR
jgi:hypothetical protein